MDQERVKKIDQDYEEAKAIWLEAQALADLLKREADAAQGETNKKLRLVCDLASEYCDALKSMRIQEGVAAERAERKAKEQGEKCG